MISYLIDQQMKFSIKKIKFNPFYKVNKSQKNVNLGKIEKKELKVKNIL